VRFPNMTTGRLPSIEGGIQPTIVDAKGDIIAASAADTPARLAVGNDGETLVADSSTATGLRYTAVGLSNPIINGGMDIWQRGTSFTTTGAYTADRWLEVNGSNSITYSRSTDVPSSPGFQYSISRAGTGSNMTQRIEAANAASFADQTVTLSFYYKSTAGTDSLGYSMYYANSADNFGGVTQIGSTQTIATPSTSWTRVTYSFSVPANGANGLAFYFFRGSTATSTTLMTGFQIDIGSVALPFRRAGGTIQGELAACQRYYVRYSSTDVFHSYANGMTTSTTVGYVTVPLPVEMRTAPTTLDTSTVTKLETYNTLASNKVLSAIAIDRPSTKAFSLVCTITGATNGQVITLRNSNDATAFFGVSAEL
jgi:hypothetical protein